MTHSKNDDLIEFKIQLLYDSMIGTSKFARKTGNDLIANIVLDYTRLMGKSFTFLKTEKNEQSKSNI